MKNLFYTLCLLIGFSSTAQSIDYQMNHLNNGKKIITIATTPISNILFNSNEEEVEEEAFDFDTATYLPVGFNATLTLDTKVYDTISIETATPFDFNTTDYLPIGFNANTTLYDAIVEIIIEEEDAPFDFDIKEYLPEGFDAYDSRLAVSTIYYFNCIAFDSI